MSEERHRPHTRPEDRQLARKAAAAKVTFQALDWKPPRPWAVKWVDGMPVPFHAQHMPRAYSTPVLRLGKPCPARRHLFSLLRNLSRAAVSYKFAVGG